MKIVQVVHGFPPQGAGGSERYVQGITEGLRDRGCALYVYAGSIEWREAFSVETTDRDGYELTEVHRNDLYFDRWDKAYNPLVEENFRSYLAHRKPDLVHVHQWIRLTSNLCRVAASSGIPVVVTLHDLYTTCPRLFRMNRNGALCTLPLSREKCLHCAERWLFQKDLEIERALADFKGDFQKELKCATKVLSPSSSHAALVTERLGLEDVRIEVLPLGTHRTLNPAPPTPAGGKLRIAFFSQLYPHKGPKVLVEAFRKMTHREKAELHLFGAEVLPDFAEELKSLAAGNDVTFHGPYTTKDMESFPMDLVVIPALVPESYSFILDEAAGLRVPVLASDVGAIPERATRAVMLHQRGDADDLARALDKLTSDQSLLEDMRGAPHVRVVPMGEHLDRLERIYREAVERGPPKTKDDGLHHRMKEQWDRREFNFKELVRSETWEALVAALRDRIEELERELGEGE